MRQIRVGVIGDKESVAVNDGCQRGVRAGGRTVLRPSAEAVAKTWYGGDEVGRAIFDRTAAEDGARTSRVVAGGDLVTVQIEVCHELSVACRRENIGVVRALWYAALCPVHKD